MAPYAKRWKDTQWTDTSDEETDFSTLSRKRREKRILRNKYPCYDDVRKLYKSIYRTLKNLTVFLALQVWNMFVWFALVKTSDQSKNNRRKLRKYLPRTHLREDRTDYGYTTTCGIWSELNYQLPVYSSDSMSSRDEEIDTETIRSNNRTIPYYNKRSDHHVRELSALEQQKTSRPLVNNTRVSSIYTRSTSDDIPLYPETIDPVKNNNIYDPCRGDINDREISNTEYSENTQTKKPRTKVLRFSKHINRGPTKEKLNPGAEVNTRSILRNPGARLKHMDRGDMPSNFYINA